MFKKRPRRGHRARHPQNAGSAASKAEPDYWRHRLFKNTFTYKGRRVEVNGWSVKMQLYGRRKTFSLSSSDPAVAAAEASQIYQVIVTQGWRAVSRRGVFAGGYRGSPPVGTDLPGAASAAHWKQRLLYRRHGGKLDTPAHREFTVRIEHAGVSQYFPLGTDDATKASRLAARIHHSVVNQGWAGTNKKFSRELTIALRWLDDPVAWTYATIHTRNGDEAAPPPMCPAPSPRPVSVAVIEPEEGIRKALAWSLNHQAGIHCDASFSNSAEALREIPRRPVHFALINHDLPNQTGTACLEELHRVKPGLVGVLFSVYEDSEHLFHYTPGGAAGYILRRTSPFQLLEPLVNMAPPITPDQIAIRVREYFRGLFNSMIFGPSALDMAKLTPRELQILALLSKGELAKEIADSLGISVWTVQGHVKSIFERLNVHTRTEAVVKFLQK